MVTSSITLFSHRSNSTCHICRLQSAAFICIKSPYGDVMVLLLQEMILPYSSSHCLFSLHCVCTTNTCTGGDCNVLLVDVTTWFLPNTDLCWEACSCAELRSTMKKLFLISQGFAHTTVTVIALLI